MDIEQSEHEQAVRERLQELRATNVSEQKVETINKRARPLKAMQQKRLRALFEGPRSVGAKIEALWLAVDDVTALARPHSACRKGCSHCCHIEVLLPEQEAALIGKRIGVTPRQVPGDTRAGDLHLNGYESPCPFLQKGLCSIYEHRPLVCRKHVSLDRDALLCELIGEPNDVPYLGMKDYVDTLAKVTTDYGRTRPKVGDIREFFPNGKR